MNYFDMNNLLLQQKLSCGGSNLSNDTDSLACTEMRDRAFSNSSVGSLDCFSQSSYNQQNNLKDLNLLLTLLAQNQPTSQTQQTTSQSLMMEKGRTNSNVSCSSDDFKGSFDFSNFSLFSQNQFDRKTGGQVFIPKPIRTNSTQKQNSFYFDSNNGQTEESCSPSNSQSSVQNLLLEASLNIFSNLMRKESSSELSVPQMQYSMSQSSSSSQQSQIMYQPNIIFGVQLTPEEMQKRREHRRAKIQKYVTKKETRKWDVLRYEVRKKIAKTRLRVKGRFVKEEKKIESDDSQISNQQIKSPNSTQLDLFI